MVMLFESNVFTLTILTRDCPAPKTKLGKPGTYDKQYRLDGNHHFIFEHPEGKHKDCAFCSNRKIPEERRETTYFCETCEGKPGLHPGNYFKKYHTL
ncbi:hypothetical protein M0802_013095 [Mischocyttarus mexicanus]|nr:hypothetical protein M0802_013095 [Mischocyttarus mexicanus]